MTRVTIWNEHVHERQDPAVADIYPDGIHAAIAAGLSDRGFDVETATLAEPEHGLTEAVLDESDVLVWWGHAAHDDVEEPIVDRVHQHVLDGLGLIVLHSAHNSKVFHRLMGTSCWLKWREAGERERCWVVDPGHPIADGIDDCFEIDPAEMYGEPFDVPQPDELVFCSWFEGGEVFRSGCCYRRGRGRIFYFRPGHETYPVYHDNTVQDVLANAADWAAMGGHATVETGNVPPREDLE